jgi:hypothetical protein
MDKGEGIASMDWLGRAVELYHDERELVCDTSQTYL